MNERSAAEILKAHKAITFEFPLSLELKVYIIFSDSPSKKEISQLKRVFDFIDGAFYPTTVETKPVNVKTKKIKRKMHPKDPCVKHPDSQRNPKTNRCIECERAHGIKMAGIFRFKREAKNGERASN